MEMSTNNEKNSKTICEKVKSTFTHFPVEPVVFLTLLASIIYQFVTQNLYLEKACRVTLNFNESICDAVSRRDPTGYTPFDEAEIQKLSSKMMAIKSVIQGFFPTCLSLFAGSWSDRHNKRKFVILTPVVGEFLSCICLILNVIFFYELPIEFSVLGDALPMSMAGGWPCLLLGVYSFVAVAISEENRTVRIGALSTIQSLSILLGMGGSGILYQYFGFIPSYGLCNVMIFISFLYGYFAIKDVIVTSDRNDKTKKESKKGMILDFFDISYAASTFKVCFGSKENNKRKRMIAITIVGTVVFGTMYGENAVAYMYTRFKLGWNAVDYSAFTVYQFIVAIVAYIFAMAILSKRLHWEDSTLGMISMMTSVISSPIFALAPSTEIFYLAAIVGGFPPFFALRSLVSKLIPLNEQGQANAVLGLCESFSSLIFMTLYTLLYKYTIDVFPGTFCLVSGSLKLIGFLGFGYLYMEVKKDAELARSKETQNVSAKI